MSTYPKYEHPNWPSLTHIGAVSIFDPQYNFFSAYHPRVSAQAFRHASGAIKQLTQQPVVMNRLQLQNHNKCVAASPWGYIKSADACYTTSPNLACSITVADCIPILLAHRSERWVAAVHAGWRGLYHNIIERSLAHCPFPTTDLQVWLGPCISQSCYEVGPEFYHKFTDKNREYQPYFQQKSSRYYPDLRAIAIHQLQQKKIKHIYNDTSCTFSNDYLPSHRQNPKQAKRFLSCVWLQTT